jgi:hypothetical protein
MFRTVTITTLALAFAVSAPAFAESELDTALASGGTRLTSDQISARITGQTVSAAKGGKKFLFYYSDDNAISGEMVGGGWSGEGYYEITDDDRVCLSMTSDKGRLRCLTLVETDGTIRKYDSTGNVSFELLGFQDGKTF